MRINLLSVGDELILGQSVDTNSAWMSQQLSAVGGTVVAHMTVSDDQPALERAIRLLAGMGEILVISGGIGPTPDDLTRQALANVLGRPLESSPLWIERLDSFFKARGRPMPQSNNVQALIPRGAKLLDNPVGTAAGIEALILSTASTTPASGGCEVFVLPGVPKEMKAMFSAHVLPRISGGGGVVRSAALHTFGLGESAVADALGSLMNRDRNPSVGTTVAGGLVTLRVNARFASINEAQNQLKQTCEACHAALGELIFGQDDQTLPQIVGALLAERRQSVTTAESCTGGLLSKLLTDAPGSSAWFQVGFITYSNKMKYERLGVSTEVINVYGAVSENVVNAMAANAKRLSKATYGLAISGIAGPEGGSALKPVGTVCIALADEAGARARTFNFPGDREMIRTRAGLMALTVLRYHLLGKPLPF